MNPFIRLSRFLRRPPSSRRSISTRTPPKLDSFTKNEEERMPAFTRGLYYPVNLGDIFHSRYKVLSKLGYGANSTVWFCRDLQHHQYVALKIYTGSSNRNSSSPRANQEVRVLEHLAKMKTNHPGSSCVHNMKGKFELIGSSGVHQCIVFEPLVTSLLHFQATLDPKSLTEDMLKGALQQLLMALDYLHAEGGVVHTDIQAKNIIISAKDDSIFHEWENQEADDPSPRKIDGGSNYTVYQSRPFHRTKGWNRSFGMPLLCDFGEARLGKGVHDGLVQPDIYRAPEVILGLRWTSKVDIWNVGVLIWDLFEDHHLFDGRGPDGRHSDVHLLAEMVAMLGPPPVGFLSQSPHSWNYWNSSGEWIGSAGVPDMSLEDSEEYLAGENKETFLRFMRKMLRWDPEERQSARELLTDPWLTSP
ncbi:kinase-like protein [Aspergillus campestris IBT 28561]|uniref:Kinase-like protein n=1 Tax=Aspergillus campestris (strain IBT 28561) TaxID=1392248 RepID=A0A2I1DGR9_ASPC2|nr:kinase-like protein [Aspergillus campestris IBT 28561]PKY09072.1 kinase-like protein [Aspergillus campestris IBT 28561]